MAKTIQESEASPTPEFQQPEVPKDVETKELHFAVDDEIVESTWLGIEGEVAEWAVLKREQAVSCIVSGGLETLIEINGKQAIILLNDSSSPNYYILSTDAEPASFPNDAVFQDESGRLKVSIKLELVEEGGVPTTIPWNTGKESYLPSLSVTLDDKDVPNGGGIASENLSFPSFDCQR